MDQLECRLSASLFLLSTERERERETVCVCVLIALPVGFYGKKKNPTTSKPNPFFLHWSVVSVGLVQVILSLIFLSFSAQILITFSFFSSFFFLGFLPVVSLVQDWLPWKLHFRVVGFHCWDFSSCGFLIFLSFDVCLSLWDCFSAVWFWPCCTSLNSLDFPV